MDAGGDDEAFGGDGGGGICDRECGAQGAEYACIDRLALPDFGSLCKSHRACLTLRFANDKTDPES